MAFNYLSVLGLENHPGVLDPPAAGLYLTLIMKAEIRELDVARGQEQLAGRVLGDRVYAEVLTPALEARAPSTVLVLSFRGVKFATGSFLKATWLRLHPDGEPAIPSVVAHLSEDVRTEFRIFLDGHRRPGLEARDWTSDRIALASLHGHLESPSFSAFSALLAAPGATAPELHRAGNESISATAWTNRLNELHRLGLALRRKRGRAWSFYPLTQEVRRG